VAFGGLASGLARSTWGASMAWRADPLFPGAVAFLNASLGYSSSVAWRFPSGLMPLFFLVSFWFCADSFE